MKIIITMHVFSLIRSRKFHCRADYSSNRCCHRVNLSTILAASSLGLIRVLIDTTVIKKDNKLTIYYFCAVAAAFFVEAGVMCIYDVLLAIAANCRMAVLYLVNNDALLNKRDDQI
jgi:hypothetical protein